MTMKKTTTTRATALVAAAVLALSGCKHDGAVTTAEPGAPRGPRTTSPAIAELLAAVPGNAAALGFIDMDDAPWSVLTSGLLLPLDEDTRKSLDKELREYVDRYIGLDLSKLQFAVGFASGPPSPRGAVVLKTVGGTLKMPGASDHEGGKVWLVDPDSHVSLAIRRDVVVCGNDAAVREVLETLAGKRKPVITENKALVDWLREQSHGAAFAFAAVKPKDLPLPPPVSGLERVAVSINATGVAAVVDGDDATISSLQAIADRAFAAGLAEVEKAHRAALAGEPPPPQGAMAIIGAAYARSYAAKLKPRRSGNRLSVSVEVSLGNGGAPAIVAGIGIMAAVAIPAFMDYMKRSKAQQSP
jgi:hypothetical protein